MSLTFNQSEINYHKYYDDISSELNNINTFKNLTRVEILDRFYTKKLINKEFHEKQLKYEIINDKHEQKYDLLYSILVSSSILLFFLIVFIPENEKFTKILFSMYILCIYLIVYYFS